MTCGNLWFKCDGVIQEGMSAAIIANEYCANVGKKLEEKFTL